MALEARIGEGAAQQVSVRQVEGGLFEVKVGERTFTVDYAPVAGGMAHLLVDGRSCDVSLVVDRDGATRVGWKGRAFPVHVYDPRRVSRAQKGAGEGGPLTVISPMPGKVIRVAVTEGTSVKKGTPLVVVEAMKMENEYKASRDGVVEKILVKEGDTLEAGAKMIVLGPPRS